ncbi:trichodiene synthase [Xylaria digitata]|nr:trichodiene synthase [Xylaria digitata]
MAEDCFPFEHFLSGLVRFLDAMKYHDNIFTREERVGRLKHVYKATAKHFDMPLVQKTWNMSIQRFDGMLQTITRVTVYCWAHIPREAMVAVNIYFVCIILLDDSGSDPMLEMGSFWDDLLHQREQKHPFWRFMNDPLKGLLAHYDSFCAITIMRSTLDYFQGCWVESRGFKGYPGSYSFPCFLRRLNGLGGVSGATLFPAVDFDQNKHFEAMATVIAQLEPQVTFVNDLMSFYKETRNPRDGVNLVTNYCRVDGVTLEGALDRVIDDSILACDGLLTLFNRGCEGHNAQVNTTVRDFVHGYVTWHLCDPRYEFHDLYERVTAIGISSGKDKDLIAKFCQYYEHATEVGGIDPKEWVVPLVDIPTIQEQS